MHRFFRRQKAEAADLTESLNAEQVMGDETLVLSQPQDVLAEAESDSVQASADYFAQVRLSRQQSRDSAVEL